jgi:prephenate dehydratase
MGLAAIAAGADGLIVVVLCDPDKALSDGAQSLFPEQFDKLMRDLDVLAPVVGKEVARIRKTSVGATAPVARSHTTASADLEPTVAFCGSRGAFAEQAIHRFFGTHTGELAMLSFRDAFQAVSTGAADFAVVPVENSLAGSVYDNYDNLWRFDDLRIAAGITLRVEHSLLAVQGATLDPVKRVYSHPHGFPQCQDFLDAHPGWELVHAPSTADAAVMVAKFGTTENAAIASGVNAAYHNLVELAAGIESDKRNYTRFAVIAPVNADGEAPLPETAAGVRKATVIFVTKNVPGALYECLGIFHHAGLNLSRLESRPIPGEPWRHSFYADMLLGEDQSAEEVADALTELHTRADEVRLLGIYREREC